jgi:hypothetical protein
MIALPASIGVGIQANPVCLPVTAQPGHSYSLGELFVQDTGSSGESISVAVEPVWRGQSDYGRYRSVPASWVSVAYPRKWLVLPQHSVTAGAGQGAYLAVTVTIPSSAASGMYVSNLVASAGTSPAPGSGTQAALGAAAATGLELGVSVRPPSCGIAPPSASALAATEHAAAAGDIVPAASASTAKTPYAGWAILILLGMVVLAGLRRLMR